MRCIVSRMKRRGLVLTRIYDVLFPDGLFLLALCMIWVAVIPRQNVEVETKPAGESLGWLFLCVPLAGWVVASLQSYPFHRRYRIFPRGVEKPAVASNLKGSKSMRN